MWIATFLQRYQSQEKEDDPITQVTDRVVQIADPVIRQAKRYRQVLAEPIAGSIRYFRSLVEIIPGPIVLHRSRFYDDPTVKALFATPDELDEVLRNDPENNILRRQGVAGDVMAIMTMRRQERTIFGHEQDGELILRDVRQQAVSFTDHRIVAPSANLDSTKAGIVKRGLEALAMVAMERITTQRSNKAELQEKKEYLQGMIRILGAKSHCQRFLATHSREDLVKLEQMLAEVKLELETMHQRIGLPEQSLAHLEEVMRSPELTLTACRKKLRLNWMGVRVDDPVSEGNDIILAEISLKENHRSAVLVTFAI